MKANDGLSFELAITSSLDLIKIDRLLKKI